MQKSGHSAITVPPSGRVVSVWVDAMGALYVD